MRNEKPIGHGYKDLYHREDEMLANLIGDFKQGKPLSWPLLSKDRVHRVWSDFVKHGSVQDERALDAIYTSIRDNVIRLQIATVVAEHTGIKREHYLEEYLDPSDQESFSNWLVDFDGQSRLSDYGLGPLQDALALAFEARTSESRLKYLDRALNITHCRGDLSRLFIDGGRGAVMQMADIAEIPTDDMTLRENTRLSKRP